MTHVLALDIGGTKLAAALIDEAGVVQARAIRPTPQAGRGDPEPVWRALVGAADEVLAAREDVIAAGVATAGPLGDSGSTVSPVNIPSWREFPLRDRLQERLRGLPVTVVGDAICAAWGEFRQGAGVGARHLVGVVVSTGIGAGLVLDGAPRFGPSGNAGHLGHMPMGSGGERCPCGGFDCVETVASGPSMVRWAVANGWSASGEPTAVELAASARRGDPIAQQALVRGATALGAALVAVAAVCDLDVAVIGGGVANTGELFLAPVRRAVRRFAGPAFIRRLAVRQAALGGDAGLIGAADLALAAAQDRAPSPIEP